MRLFHTRTYNQLFPALAAAVALMAVAAAPQLVDPTNLVRVLTVAIGVGTIGSAILFLILKVLDWRAVGWALRQPRPDSPLERTSSGAVVAHPERVDRVPAAAIPIATNRPSSVADRPKQSPGGEAAIVRWKPKAAPATTGRTAASQSCQPAKVPERSPSSGSPSRRDVALGRIILSASRAGGRPILG